MFVLALVFQTTNVHIISYIYCIYIAQIAHTDLTGLCSVNMVVSETRPPSGRWRPSSPTAACRLGLASIFEARETWHVGHSMDSVGSVGANSQMQEFV